MITKTTNLSPEYFALFEEIEAKSNGEIKIENLEQFFGNIQEIKDLDEKFLRLPLDEPMFEINADTRKIDVESTPFKANGLSVQGDHLAETVFFKINKYFDIMDLMNTDIFINWKMGGVSGRTACFIKSDAIIPGYIVFGWPISNDITNKSGQLNFAVQLEIKQNGEIAYSLNTLVASLMIKDGLVLVNPTVYDMRSDIHSILFNSSFTDGGIEVNNPVWITEGLVKDLNDNEFKTEINLEPQIVDGVLSNKPMDLYALAGAGRDAVIAYSNMDKSPMTAEIIAINPDEELNDNIRYYIKKEDVYEVAPQSALDKYGTEDAEPLFIKAAKLTIDSVGSYYINAQSVKYGDQDGVKKGASSVFASTPIIVPETEQPSSVIMQVPEREELDGYTYEDAENTIFITPGKEIDLIASPVLEKEAGLLKFDWYKGNECVLPQDYSNKQTSSLTTDSEGVYKVKVKHFRNYNPNGASEKECVSDSYLVSYLASPIKASLEDNIIVELNRSKTGNNVKGESNSFIINYNFEEEQPYSDNIVFELLNSNEEVVPAVFEDAKNGEKKCIVNSRNINKEGYFTVKVSNKYNGSVYAVKTAALYININEI